MLAEVRTKHRLLSDFLRLKKRPEDTIGQHVGKLKEKRAALKNLGEDYSDEFFQVIVINSLPAEFGDLLGQWDTLHGSMKTTAFIQSWLKQKEVSLNGAKGELALAVSGPAKKPWDQLSIRERKKISRCKICNTIGHWAKECQKGEQQDNAKKDEQRLNVILNIGNLGPELKKSWVLDSGASQHMCNELGWFTDIAPYNIPNSASVGNGEKIEVWGIGSVRIECRVNGKTIEGTLTGVSFIPTLGTNLISVRAMSRKGMNVCFEGGKCVVKKGEEVVMVGKLGNEGVYVLMITAAEAGGANACVVRNVRSLKEWHETLGHLGQDRFEEMIRDGNHGIQGYGELGTCSSCPAGKAAHVPHPTRTSEIATKVGERVHVDLGTITNKEASSTFYFLLCKDEASSFTFIYFLDRKSDVHRHLEQLVPEFEILSGAKITRLMSDNGTEFLNHHTQRLFHSEGIIHETSAPYVSQQNGRVEREIRTICTIARKMLIEANLPETFEKEALRTACYIKNRIVPSKGLRTPHEVFTGRKPLLGHLVKFCTPVQVKDWSQNKDNPAPRTLNGHVVGFTLRRNTYRVFIPAIRRVIESCDVYSAPHYREQAPTSVPVRGESSREVALNIDPQKVSGIEEGQPGEQSTTTRERIAG